METQDENKDILGDNLGEKERMVSSSSAFTPVEPCSEYSPPFFLPPGANPPPFLPTPSPQGWYSSLLSSLYQTSSAIMRQEQNNNNLEEESVKKLDKEESDERHDKDEIHNKETLVKTERESGEL